MKLIKSTAIALVLGTFAMSSAQALTLDAPGVVSPSVNLTINDGVATLFGTVDSAPDRAFAEQHVAQMEGVQKVINLISYN